MAGTPGGEVLLPNGNTCSNTSEPIQCSLDDGGFVLKRVGSQSYSTDELGYKCCLPYKCDADKTDVIIFNVLHAYGKYI